MPVISINSSAEFKKVLGGGKPVLCDWYATWCGPCKAVAPRIEQLSNKYPAVTFIKVDVDAQSSLAREHGVTAMPTFHLFVNGVRKEEIVGANVSKIEQVLNKYAQGTVFGGTGHVLGSGEKVQEQQGFRINWIYVIGAIWVLYKMYMAHREDA